MLINFALEVVGTRISSDKVSTDGYESSNLISNNWHLRRKGFLAEYFIKPPVNITFEFPCNVCIHHIFVTPSVGQQQSSYIELYSASKPQPKTAIGIQKLEAASHKLCEMPQTSAGSLSTSSIFYPISRMSVSDSDRICFYNPNVSDICHNDIANNIMVCQHRTEIKHFKKEVICASSHLTLRIVRTVRGSTAAVSSIDILGTPAISVPAAVRNDILNKYAVFINESGTVKDLKMSTKAVNTTRESSSNFITVESSSNPKVENSELEIPEDFLDAITCEVMAVPMLLPSGKNVDLSTLDRYSNVEASYGRQPRDPFTGLQFSSTSKPIPNAALKARIDKFLMEHSDNSATLTIARTVRAEINNSRLGKRKNSEYVHDGVSSIISKGLQQPLTNNVPKRINPEPLPLNSSFASQQTPAYFPDRIKNDSGLQTSQPNTGFSSNIKNCSFECSHESQLKDSLNDALSSILSGLPSYLSNPHSTADSEMCMICKRAFSVDIASYVTPCCHFICRECLTADSTKSMTCEICRTIFNTSDVIRKHFAI